MKKSWIIALGFVVLINPQATFANGGVCQHALEIIKDLRKQLQMAPPDSPGVTEVNQLLENLGVALEKAPERNPFVTLKEHLNRPIYEYTLVQEFPNNVRVVSAKTNQGPQLFLQIGFGREMMEYPILTDSRSGALAIQGGGDQLLNLLIAEGRNQTPNERATSSVTMTLVDVNFLGLVNYFPRGQSSGDDYLKAVSGTIEKSFTDAIATTAHLQIRTSSSRQAGQRDFIFRTGGDEITIMSAGVPPFTQFQINKRINEAVIRSPEVQIVFEEQRQFLRQEIARTDITEEQREELKKSLEKFMKIPGSVSIASIIVGSEDDFSSLQAKLANVFSQSKVIYKGVLGLETDKYGGDAKAHRVEPEIIDGFIAPPVFFPILPPDTDIGLGPSSPSKP